jgi:hypothetical protein
LFLGSRRADSKKVIFYKKIAARTELQVVYNITLGFLGLPYTVIFFDIIFQCYPIERKWTTDPKRMCFIRLL